MNHEITESGLTDKQERFAHEYLIDQNASAACLRAGYSPHSKGVQAAQLMNTPAVRKRIRGLLEELYDKIKLDAEQLMRERMRTAFFDPRRLFDADSQPIPFKELDAECAGVVVVSYDTRSNGDKVTRVRQPSRAAALTALEKRLMQFMKMQQEDTITERENADFYLAMGTTAERVAAGEVIRLTPDREVWKRGGEGDAAFPGAGIQPPSQPHCGEACKPLAFGGGQQCCPKPLLTPLKGEGADREGAGLVPVAEAEAQVTTAQVVDTPAPVQAKSASPLVQQTPSKVCVPTAKASKKGWSDAWGNIDVDHPHIPPEVKARELEKRRRKAEEEAGRNNPGLLLNYMHSTVGQPNPPWPKPLVRSSKQKFAISEDDPFGTGGEDY